MGAMAHKASNAFFSTFSSLKSGARSVVSSKGDASEPAAGALSYIFNSISFMYQRRCISMCKDVTEEMWLSAV